MLTCTIKNKCMYVLFTAAAAALQQQTSGPVAPLLGGPNATSQSQSQAGPAATVGLGPSGATAPGQPAAPPPLMSQPTAPPNIRPPSTTPSPPQQGPHGPIRPLMSREAIPVGQGSAAPASQGAAANIPHSQNAGHGPIIEQVISYYSFLRTSAQWFVCLSAHR